MCGTKVQVAGDTNMSVISLEEKGGAMGIMHKEEEKTKDRNSCRSILHLGGGLTKGSQKRKKKVKNIVEKCVSTVGKRGELQERSGQRV